jgi:indole-3-glycerol phosphate synthase
VLESLYAGSLEDAAARESVTPISLVETLAADAVPALNAVSRLAPRDSIHVLAEIKRASPSKGALAEIANPIDLAKTYESAGASVISVLTEQRRFKGSLEDLEDVKRNVAIPVLRKDFIATEYQVLEARAAGADLVLLIVAGLEPKRLVSLKELIEQLGMTAFIETHSADEVRFAVDSGAKLLGVNARDLSTFETDRDLFGSLANLIPANVIKVAESAVRNVDDVRHYRNSGADVVLVGEALVTGDPAQLIKSFLEV